MAPDKALTIQSLNPSDKSWVESLCKQRWGSDKVVTRGILHFVPDLPGFVAWRSGQRVGLLTYQTANEELEIVTLDSVAPNTRVGSALISKAVNLARTSNYQRVWLITTNDNTPALRFYQRKGFHIVALHRNALVKARKIKPEIPSIGIDGIPLRDEIEIEIVLN